MTLRRYLTKLIWLSVAPMVVLAAWFAFAHVDTVRAGRARDAADRARNAVLAVDRFLQANIDGLQVLAASPLLEDASRWPEFYAEAKGFRAHFGGHVILAEPGGRMLVNTRVPLGRPLPMLPRPRGHAAAPEVLATGRPSVGDVFPGPIAKEPLFAIVVPVRREGRTAFLLLSTVETRGLDERLEALALPKDWSVSLLDSKGDVVARRPDGEPGPPGEAAREGRFVMPSTIAPWKVVLDVPPGEYRAPITAAAAGMLAAIVGTTLVSLLGGFVTGRRLAKAVATLDGERPQPGAAPEIAEFEAVRRSLAAKDAARGEADRTLRESERRFRTLVEEVPNIAVQGYDRERRVVVWNAASEALYGYTKEEALGRRLEDLIIPGPMRDDVIRAVSAWVDGGAPVPAGELVLRRKDGSPVHVFSGHAMLADHAGGREMYCIDVDLTALRRAEAQAIEWRGRYETAIRASGQILREWIPSTNAMTIMGDTQRILGYPTSGMAGGLTRWRELIHPEDLPTFDRDLERAIAARAPFHQQYRVRRQDGEWLTMQDDGYFVLDEAGEIACMVCFVVDVTERSRARLQIESQLAELQRWYGVTLGREKRVAELKAEVNELRRSLGEPAAYGSPEGGS